MNRKWFNTIAALAVIVISSVTLVAACSDDAKVASQQLTKAADNFEIIRRVVFINGITDRQILQMEGRCSIEDQGHQLEVTCKMGPDAYAKHFLGLADNVTYLVEQVELADVNVYHYRRTFKPQAILPDIDFRGDVGAAIEAVTPDKSD